MDISVGIINFHVLAFQNIVCGTHDLHGITALSLAGLAGSCLSIAGTLKPHLLYLPHHSITKLSTLYSETSSSVF